MVKLKPWTRRVLEKTEFGRRALEVYGLYRRNRLAASHGNARAFFTNVYETNFWNDPESFSGPDSTVAYTGNLRRELAELLLRLDVRRILDAPCGDFNWFRLVDLPPGAVYAGGDIVEALVARNATLYGKETRTFHVIDICRDPLPASDLWICRNAMFHLSYADIYAALRNCLNSGIGYFLATTHPRCDKNVDIPSGSYRLLNLELSPFLFPAPLARIEDWAEGEDVRQICLWRREQIAKVMSGAPAPAR
jgi:hypothetical protein